MAIGCGVSVREHEKIGSYLRRLRIEAGLTQNEVSKLLGYSSAQYISNFERGVQMAPLLKLKKMMDIYGGDINHLIELMVEAEKKSLQNSFHAFPVSEKKSAGEK